MQGWLGERLSALAKPRDEFVDVYGEDFSLGVRISARRKLIENEIKGPTIFKKVKDVEYTLFLPFDVIQQAKDACRAAADFILSGVEQILVLAHIELPDFEARKVLLIEQICSDPSMLKRPWSVVSQ